MAVDPMTCRRHAKACLRLAETAKTSELSTALLSMARTWAKLATETEHYETVLFAPVSYTHLTLPTILRV